MPRRPGLPAHNLFDLGGSFHIDPLELASAIIDHGVGAEWRRAIVCPCVRPDTRTPRLDCKTCRGIGWAYPEPMRCSTLILATNRTASSRYGEPGVMVDGDMRVTLPPGHVPGLGDMFLPDNEAHVVQQRFFRNATMRSSGAANEAILRAHHGLDAVPMAQVGRVERLLYPSTECIEQVTYMQPDLSEGAEPDDEVLVLAHEREYHVDTDGGFRWHAGYGPGPGRAWTVRYRAPAAYVVMTSGPVLRQDGDTPLPWMATLKRLDRLAQEDMR